MRVFSSSRAGRSEQGLSLEKPAQIEQGSDGNSWVGFVTQESADAGIKHPRGNGKDRPVPELNDVTILGHTPKAPHELAVVTEKGMMPVANPNRRR
jgi:hypothetical protein